MSLLTPIKVPVKVYKWDDVGAPQLDKTAGCMMTIFKACLVTGYGTKESAGWTMPFESTSTGAKVFRPPSSPDTDFYLRCSADTGQEMAAQVYLDMTDANTGDMKLQCATPFKYGVSTNDGPWVLLATSKSIYFFCHQYNRYGGTTNDRSGSFFLAGSLQGVSTPNTVFIHHTGGNYNDSVYASLTGLYNQSVRPTSDTDRMVLPQILTAAGGSTPSIFKSAANSQAALTSNPNLAAVYVIADSNLYIVPGLYISFDGAQHANASVVDLVTDDNQPAIIFSSSTFTSDNIYIAASNWVY